jgi:phosphohistidine phosphatase SixA
MAAVQGPWSDADRPLTAEGEEQAHAAARGLACLELDLQVIQCSPALRCRHTAQIVAQTLGFPEQAIEVVEALSLTTSMATLQGSLPQAESPKSVLWVGHQPVLERFAARLLWAGAALPLQIHPAACMGLHCRFRDATPHATLLWFMRSHELGLLRCRENAAEIRNRGNP